MEPPQSGGSHRYIMTPDSGPGSSYVIADREAGNVVAHHTGRPPLQLHFPLVYIFRKTNYLRIFVDVS